MWNVNMELTETIKGIAVYGEDAKPIHRCLIHTEVQNIAIVAIITADYNVKYG